MSSLNVKSTALACAIELFKPRSGATAAEVVAAAGQFATFLEGADAPAPEAPATKPPAKAAGKAKAPEAPAADGKLEYERDVQPELHALLAKKGRAHAVAVLATFGAKKATDVPAEKWSELIAAFKAKANDASIPDLVPAK